MLLCFCVLKVQCISRVERPCSGIGGVRRRGRVIALATAHWLSLGSPTRWGKRLSFLSDTPQIDSGGVKSAK